MKGWSITASKPGGHPPFTKQGPVVAVVVMQGGSSLLPIPPVQSSDEQSISSISTAQGSGEARRAERGRGKTWLLDSKYVLGEELGRGASGRVYRALNQGGGGSHFVAIKEIPLVGVVRSRPFKPSLSLPLTTLFPTGMSVAAARAVESEVELLRNLSHPQIIRFYETIRTEHHLYLVLEYVENGSLAPGGAGSHAFLSQ